MSVLKRFRSESKMQFYATAQKLRKDIMPLRQGFAFCKIRYSFTDSGRLLMRPVRETFTRERRRLKTAV